MHAPSARPYWHVDAKWVCGLLALGALGVALLFFNLSTLTERERAIKLSGTIVAGLFSREGLDDEQGLVEFRQKVQAMPGDTVAPLEQYPWLVVSKHDALTLNARELRVKIFSQLTAPIYDKGLKGAAAEMTPDPVAQEKFVRDATLLGFFTKTTHETLRGILMISSIAAVMFVSATIFFSARLGRVVTPGILLVIAGFFGVFLGVMVRYPPRDGDAPFAALPSSVTIEIGNSLLQSYGAASLLGGGLLLVAGVLKIVSKFHNPDHS